MDFTNDDYPEINYDAQTTFEIKSALFTLLQEVEKDSCVTCGKHLDLNHAFIYEHNGGWVLIDSLPKQWVSILCTCGYHNSINKLGVRNDR
jgi:hypothetical protein